MATASDSPPATPPRWLAVTVLAVAAVAFGPSLGGGFLADDFVYIVRFRELPWSEWPGLFIREWSDGVWGMPLRELRPFAALSYMSDARFFGGDPLGYRLTNLLLHLLATLLVARLAWFYSCGKVAAALVAGLLFALHPAHAEAVAWITGRVDLIGTVAALLFWLAAEIFSDRGHPGRLALALFALFLGVFSKEFCLFAPLVLLLRWVLLDLRAGGPVWIRRGTLLGGAIAIIAIYGYCRHLAFGAESVGYNLWRDEPAWHRQAGYVGWLAPILPFTGRAEWKSFPALGTLHGLWLGLAAVVAAGLTVALWRRTRVGAHAWFFGGLWYFLTVAPLTAVVYFSPRHLYFPTVGLAIGLGLACAGARWRAALGAVLVGWIGVAHLYALKPWRENGAISAQALAALDRELATASPGTVALTAVPEMRSSAWLWAWSSPQSMRAPFLAHAPERVVERQVNYARADHWFNERKPLETVRTAPEAVALYVDGEGRVLCRRVPREELQRRAEALAALGTGISPEAWSAWVKTLAQP